MREAPKVHGLRGMGDTPKVLGLRGMGDAPKVRGLRGKGYKDMRTIREAITKPTRKNAFRNREYLQHLGLSRATNTHAPLKGV
eukprot:365738-Chlamydomonas_euryale.AAC.2